MTAWGAFGLVPHARAQAFVDALAAQWFAGETQREALRIADGICRSIWFRGERALHARLRRQGDKVVYLNVSHHHLDKPATIERLKDRTAAQFVPIVQDLIPIEFPEYQRPKQEAAHHRRIATVTRLADGVVVTSQATADLLKPRMEAANRDAPILVSHLGLDLLPEPTPPPANIPRPYFIVIGTIEPRKNHLLLLKLWRRIALEQGEAAPHLVIVGRRGWENENVVDMLERCPSIRGKVHEYGKVTDTEVCGLIQGAQALLFPSFSEGFGLPLIEALALGTPVLCSDIPPFVEVGAGAPEFFDPLDGPSWHQAICDYTDSASPRRAAQIARLRNWVAPNWTRHFQEVGALLNDLASA
jgi:glycosyltransferase involved in cell wall biosynthesis